MPRGGSRTERRQAGRGSRLADLVPILLVGIGFLLIGLGWNGAASLDHTEGQIPYLISGGLAGVAAVLYGSASMIVRAIRRGEARRQEELQALTQTLQRLAAVLSWSSNGHSAAAGRPEPAPELELVVAGPTSFHVESCRIVKGREETLVRIPRPEAASQGLSPCRICNP